jgi:streptogramin lyase/tRNA A-37 threonylcarbamoyl transferase component Bud32
VPGRRLPIPESPLVLQPPAMVDDTRVGTQLGGYRIERVIGRGGMSSVYLAHHVRLERRVALKLLAPELADSERFRDRFLRESRLAASIDHPNIVPIYDADEADGTLFIAMRYVEGSDLKDVIRAEGRLDAARTAAIIDQIASALDAAHARGLVHRDVKPGNVLLTPEDHVYVSDFGLTKRAVSVSGLTATGQLVGTIDYVAPEHIKGEMVDGRADVYSLGCVVVECFTGHVPYPRDLEVGVLWAHVEEPPPKVTDERPDLSVEVDEVVAAAMAKDPDERTAAAGEVATGLRSALGLEAPTGEQPAPPRPRPARKPRRRRGLIAAVVGVGLLVAVGGAVLMAGGGGGETTVPPVNSVARIDAGATAFSTPVSVGQDPTGVAIAEDGDLWVINQGDSTVSRIDPENGEVTSTKSTLGIPTGVAAGEGAVWVSNGFGGPSGTGEVIRVDLTDESVEAAFASGNAKAIVVAFGSIWLADADRDLVLRFDPEDLDAAPLEIPTDEDTNASAAPRWLAVGTGAAEGIWVANELGDTVLRIDPETNEVAGRIQVESPFAVAADDHGVWVTSDLNDRVHLFDPAGRAVRTFDTADGVLDGPTAIVIARSAVWIGSDLELAVARIDPETNAIERIAVDGITGGMVVDDDGGVWVAVRAQTV